MSGKKKDKKNVEDKKHLPHGWIVVPSKKHPDRVYFYNTVTKCSTWNNPCKEFAESVREKSPSERSSLSKKDKLKKRKKLLKNKQKNNKNDPQSVVNVNCEIEDYDEENDEYFENATLSAQSKPFSPINSPNSSSVDSLSKKITNLQKSNSTSKNEKKEFRSHFSASPENLKKSSVKKSSVVSGLEIPSTSKSSETGSVDKLKKKNKRSQSVLMSEKIEMEIEKEKERNALKKKRPLSLNESQRKSLIDKIAEPTLFKKRDKTPAQTRLLKLRAQNAQLIKDYVAEVTKPSTQNHQESDSQTRKFSSDVSTPAQTRLLKLRAQNAQLIKDYVAEVTKPSTQNHQESDSQTQKFSSDVFPSPKIPFSVSSSGAYTQGVQEICGSEVYQRHEENSSIDFSEEIEEMDWEPSAEDLDVRDINDFRQNIDRTASSLSNDIFFGPSTNSIQLPFKTNWILVLDTNILVSCLGFIKDLRDTNIPGLGFPILYIPWRVLQELDHLKDSKKTNGGDRQIHVNVRMAISYLNENFKTNHPRCFGQSFEDFVKMVDVEVCAPDDEILQTCLKLQKIHEDKKLSLLTNDKNLESKALVSNVEAYSKERFQKKFLSSGSRTPPHVAAYNGVVSGPSEVANQTDYILCGVKNILKNFIPLIVETEMKIAFEDKWIKLAYKKPPWTLQDAMDCFLKHWRSVFFLLFSKNVLAEAETLYENLFKKVPDTVEDAREVVRTVQNLLVSIKKSLKEKREYLELIDLIVVKLDELLVEVAKGIRSQNTETLPKGSFSSFLGTPPNLEANKSFSQETRPPDNCSDDENMAKLKDLFKDIWDRLWKFCVSVCEVMNSTTPKLDIPTAEFRLKTSHVLNEITSLINALDQVFNINVVDVNENHPLILELSNFLLKLYPSMDESLRNKLPFCLTTFFSDLDGRKLLSISLNDFKDFSIELSKAIDYFNSAF